MPATKLGKKIAAKRKAFVKGLRTKKRNAKKGTTKSRGSSGRGAQGGAW